MYKSKTIGVVIPAYNEEKMITKVLTTIPEFVDKIVVVNDCSTDNTKRIAEEYQNKEKRLILINHKKNGGVGKAIATGYKEMLKLNIDVIAVMAGDGQMDPDMLHKIIEPVVKEEVDYVKGNRLFNKIAWQRIPKHRYIGNAILSLLTKIASGYWFIADFQCGYTAISNEMLKKLDIDKIYPRYGMPNDLLVKLNVLNCKVKDIDISPIYNIGEKSNINLLIVIPQICWLLFKGFFWRLKEKYVIRDFHPLVFFYLFAFLLIPLGLILGLVIIYRNTALLSGPGHRLPIGYMILCVLLLLMGFQSMFFAMWFDMDDNKKLRR